MSILAHIAQAGSRWTTWGKDLEGDVGDVIDGIFLTIRVRDVGRIANQERGRVTILGRLPSGDLRALFVPFDHLGLIPIDGMQMIIKVTSNSSFFYVEFDDEDLGPLEERYKIREEMILNMPSAPLHTGDRWWGDQD